jgi:hypothetical protein
MQELNYKTVICGSGIACTGLLVNAARQGTLNEFLDRGVAFLDKGREFGAGTIGRYMIRSDSAAGVFVECIDQVDPGLFGTLKDHPLVRAARSKASRPMELQQVGRLMKLIGKEFSSAIYRHRNSDFFSRTKVISAHQKKNGGYLIKAMSNRKGNDRLLCFHSDSVVLSMGGRQNNQHIAESTIGQTVSLAGYRNKLMFTDDLLTPSGMATFRERIKQSSRKKVVIIGSSHSAFSSVWLMLNKSECDFSAEDIAVLYRNKPKLFYLTKEEARQEGYLDFDENDICPLTRRVFRLSGLRYHSRDVLKQSLGIGGEKDARIKLVPIPATDDATLGRLLEEACVIIPAFGYEPEIIPVYDEKDELLELNVRNGQPLVNNYCQVTDHHGNPVPSLYAIGLGTGFNPRHVIGGESSFSGQANGVWMYQNGVGKLIYDQLMA